ARLKPRIPSELLLAARRNEHLAGALAEEDAALRAVPVGDAALRLRRAVVERVGDRREPFAAGGLEQPLHIRTGKVAELVEAQRDVFDNETVIALRARHLELVAGDLLDARCLD